MPRVNLDAGIPGFHPLETEIAFLKGTTKGRVAAGIVLGIAVTTGFNWIVNRIGSV